jgi:hypothetical protein
LGHGSLLPSGRCVASPGDGAEGLYLSGGEGARGWRAVSRCDAARPSVALKVRRTSRPSRPGYGWTTKSTRPSSSFIMMTAAL